MSRLVSQNNPSGQRDSVTRDRIDCAVSLNSNTRGEEQDSIDISVELETVIHPSSNDDDVMTPGGPVSDIKRSKNARRNRKARAVSKESLDRLRSRLRSAGRDLGITVPDKLTQAKANKWADIIIRALQSE